MIALDTGDKLRAYASVADKIDYTVHGMVNDDVGQLSDGQLAGAEADIYTAPGDAGLVSTLVFVNTHNATVTCNLYLKPSGGTSRRIIPKDTSISAGYSLHYDGVRLFINDEKGNVVFYEEDDVVAVPSGYVHLMRQADNTLTVPLIDSDRHQQIDVVALPADVAAAEGAALGRGVLLQGDDGTDRHNIAVDGNGRILVTEEYGVDIEGYVHSIDDILAAGLAVEGQALGKGILLQGDDGTDRTNVLVDTAGHLQVDILSGGGSDDSIATEGVAATKGTQISLDDGTDSHYAQANAAGDLKVTLDSEAVVLGTGAAAIGKLAANSGVDIGDVDILSLPALTAGSAKIGSVDVGKKSGTWTSVVVNINTATTTELKAGVAGHTYTVLTISLTVAAENNLTWKSAANAISGPMDFGAVNEPHGWQANLWPCGLKCVAGEALQLTTTTTGQVSGFIAILDES